ncbi:oxygenase MpaB family protein [Mucilaginibacter agri]|uniref:DUF2236 domain-containing protein n=1 Tax=Mucilaginibacter agri TaxID=2695265 RepID=A0A965ZK52_9SPHI|nr:oxygenase MpaB family protein [Mucilaginibacter agri]NCD71146.1 DUF2236 domain-containing protein [Mucilaginibacter agri]
MEYFVKEDSIVRKIWGNADTVLFIFAGAAAEFAVNKAVDWLYFTGKLPADPLGRLFSTVTYAQQILFATNEDACAAIDRITAIHGQVESARGEQIPDWAYRDVLFFLIDYSIRAFELLERQLTLEEKTEVFNVFCKVGVRMHLNGMPLNYPIWQLMREDHLQNNLEVSRFTEDLFTRYQKHLGVLRFQLLKQVQASMAPDRVTALLAFGSGNALRPAIFCYRLINDTKLQTWVRELLLPVKYKAQIQAIDLRNLYEEALRLGLFSRLIRQT